MPAAYIDPSLDVLRTQLKGKYRGVTIYWIGDPAHAARRSDHNPEEDGSVDAIDIMVTAAFTSAQVQQLVDTLVRNKDWRISYIIWNRRIWKASTGWKTYNGNDPHTNHIHLSRNDIRETNRDPWVIDDAKKGSRMLKVAGEWPELKHGRKDSDYTGYHMVARVQRELGIKADGDYGNLTRDALKRRWNGTPPATRKQFDLTGNTVGEAEYRNLFGLSR